MLYQNIANKKKRSYLIVTLFTLGLVLSFSAKLSALDSNGKLGFAQKEKRLCKANERIIHSFITLEKKKIVSICMAKSDAYMIYRFGAIHKVGKYSANKFELVFPEKLEKSFSQFIYSYYLRGGWKENSGLDLNYLKFTNKGFIYLIYDEYDAETASRSIGIKVFDPETKKEVDMKGDPKTLKGTMIHLRDYDEIIKGGVDPDR